MNSSKKDANETDEKYLRRMAWKHLSKDYDYETLVLLLKDAYELGVKEGESKGYIDGLKRGVLEDGGSND